MGGFFPRFRSVPCSDNLICHSHFTAPIIIILDTSAGNTLLPLYSTTATVPTVLLYRTHLGQSLKGDGLGLAFSNLQCLAQRRYFGQRLSEHTASDGAPMHPNLVNLHRWSTRKNLTSQNLTGGRQRRRVSNQPSMPLCLTQPADQRWSLLSPKNQTMG